MKKVAVDRANVAQYLSEGYQDLTCTLNVFNIQGTKAFLSGTWDYPHLTSREGPNVDSGSYLPPPALFHTFMGNLASTFGWALVRKSIGFMGNWKAEFTVPDNQTGVSRADIEAALAQFTEESDTYLEDVSDEDSVFNDFDFKVTNYSFSTTQVVLEGSHTSVSDSQELDIGLKHLVVFLCKRFGWVCDGFKASDSGWRAVFKGSFSVVGRRLNFIDKEPTMKKVAFTREQVENALINTGSPIRCYIDGYRVRGEDSVYLAGIYKWRDAEEEGMGDAETVIRDMMDSAAYAVGLQLLDCGVKGDERWEAEFGLGEAEMGAVYQKESFMNKKSDLNKFGGLTRIGDKVAVDGHMVDVALIKDANFDEEGAELFDLPEVCGPSDKKADLPSQFKVAVEKRGPLSPNEILGDTPKVNMNMGITYTQPNYSVGEGGMRVLDCNGEVHVFPVNGDLGKLNKAKDFYRSELAKYRELGGRVRRMAPLESDAAFKEYTGTGEHDNIWLVTYAPRDYSGVKTVKVRGGSEEFVTKKVEDEFGAGTVTQVVSFEAGK